MISSRPIGKNFIEDYISDSTQLALDLKINEAPIDGTAYNRKDGGWVAAGGGGGGGQTENFSWKFSTSTIASDPGSTYFRMDNSTPSLVTNLYLDDICDVTGIDISTIFGTISGNWDIYLQQTDDATKFIYFSSIGGNYVDNTGWWTIPVTFNQVGSGGIPANNKKCSFLFINKNSSNNVDLQTAYDNSSQIVTDNTNGALKVQGGTTNDADFNIESKDNSGVTTLSVDGYGNIIGNSLIVGSSLEVGGSAILPANTNIGNVSGVEISYLDGVTSNIQSQLSGKINTPNWANYSSTSTIVGWSSYTQKFIYLTNIGNIIHVIYQIEGTSNSTSVSFTLPSTNTSGFVVYAEVGIINNSTGQANPGVLSMANGSNTVSFVLNGTGTAFTSSGTKAIRGQFFYKT